MYNLTNSPSGPIGQAGQSNMSTMPQGLTANGPATFNNFGKGIDAFTKNLSDKFNKMFGGLYGGDGTLGQVAEPPGQNLMAGANSIFGSPQDGMSGPQAPQVISQGALSNPNTNMPQANTPTAPDGGGFLSNFMQGQ